MEIKNFFIQILKIIIVNYVHKIVEGVILMINVLTVYIKVKILFIIVKKKSVWNNVQSI